MAANSTIWNKTKEIYFKTSDKRFYEYLACAEDPKIIKNYLNIWEHSRSNTIAQSDNLDAMFNSIVTKQRHNDEIFDYILKSFRTFMSK